jgi:hypothetical protein
MPNENSVKRFQCQSRKDLKPTNENESLHEISNDNRIRVVNFTTKKPESQKYDVPTSNDP